MLGVVLDLTRMRVCTMLTGFLDITRPFDFVGNICNRSRVLSTVRGRISRDFSYY